ncbi:hypothetical protein Leryth_004529 [Lithospermum erythrorhizon]|nr:hypothetical protein Leryth_004529 [Lithospermum erythrorhizon]
MTAGIATKGSNTMWISYIQRVVGKWTLKILCRVAPLIYLWSKELDNIINNIHRLEENIFIFSVGVIGLISDANLYEAPRTTSRKAFNNIALMTAGIATKRSNTIVSSGELDNITIVAIDWLFINLGPEYCASMTATESPRTTRRKVLNNIAVMTAGIACKGSNTMCYGVVA